MKLVNARFQQRGFTLVELLVVVMIITILTALMLPVLKMAIESAHQVTCANGLKQNATGVLTYASDYRQYLPPGAASISGSSAEYEKVEVVIGKTFFDQMNNAGDKYIGAGWTRYHTTARNSEHGESLVVCPSIERHRNTPVDQQTEVDLSWTYVQNGAFVSMNDGAPDYVDTWDKWEAKGGWRKLVVYGSSECSMFLDSTTGRGNYIRDTLLWDEMNVDTWGREAHVGLRHGPKNGDRGTVFNTVFMDGHVEPHDAAWLFGMTAREKKLYWHNNMH